MSGLVIILIAIVVLGAGYLFYGRYLANKWGIDPGAKTPAYTENDGVDYVPGAPGVVFGHQFASIAGAGPINGPIQAALFGWMPVLLWILIGGVFIGGVQDFSAMYASVKNKGRSIGYIIELYIGKLGKKLFLAFTWLFSILVTAAFADIVAKTFNGVGGTPEANLAGGQVSMTSILFIFLAVALGFILRSGKFSTAVNTVITVLFLVLSVSLGMLLPVYLDTNTWHIITFIYIAIASVTPVWALLQPRDYLNSYLLVAMILLAAGGIIIANPTMQLTSFAGWQVNGQTIFPYLFVTVACGAVSGFHALVASGTASKQVQNEKHMLPISYGAMMMESLLAVISVVAVGACYTSRTLVDAGTPTVVFANSISGFLTNAGMPSSLSYTLLTLAVSAFALTSLDSVARIGRLAWQEMFLDSSIKDSDIKGLRALAVNKYFATVVTLVFAYSLAKVGYANIWPLFGSANQLLSALTLIACAVYLRRTKRRGAYLWVPMFLMLAVTLTMLVITVVTKREGPMMYGDILQIVFAIALFIMGIIIAVSGIKKLFAGREE